MYIIITDDCGISIARDRREICTCLEMKRCSILSFQKRTVSMNGEIMEIEVRHVVAKREYQ